MANATLFQAQSLMANIEEMLYDDLKEPKSTTQILRIFTSFGKLPLKYLEVLISPVPSRCLQEVQVCVESTLRPCLLDINEDTMLSQKLTALTRKSCNLGLMLKFFFLRPSVQVGTCSHPFRNFVEKDLARAIQALREHDTELSDILGEESVLPQLSATDVVPKGTLGHGLYPMNFVDEML